MDKLIASSVALGVALCLSLTYASPKPIASPVAPPRQAEGVLTANPKAWDGGLHTEHTLEGLQELRESLEAATPSESADEGKVIHLAVIQSYIALQVMALPPARRAEAMALSQDLFKMILSDTKNPKKSI